MRRSTVVSAAAATAALLLTSMTAPAVAADGGVVINEFSASTTGTDVEYIELLAPPGTDLSAYRVLEIEGDVATFGIVDEVVSFPTASSSGHSLVSLPANALENGTISLLLVTGTIPALGADLDADNDGVIDAASGLTIVDAVAVTDGTVGDLTYGGVSLGVAYDGQPFAPGGASRIPDGTDTDSTADWVRNDFDLAGIPGSTGTLIAGEAANTPGAANSLTVPPPPPPPGDADCAADIVTIGSIQGAGASSPAVGTTVRVEGVVVGDFQAAGGLDGYYLQDAGDGDPATSDGIFIYALNGADVSAGDIVNVAGPVSEFASAGGTLTEITAADIDVCETGGPLPAATTVTLPAGPEARESVEGMYVTFPQSLSILEYFEFGRFGTVEVGVTRQMQPTAVHAPGSPEAADLAAQNTIERITLDDGRGIQNSDPALHPNGEVFTLANSFRGGDQLTNITGIMDYRFGGWTVQPTEGADYAATNPRSDAPDVGGDLVVSSFNVLNYFTTLNLPGPGDDAIARGAESELELSRQQAKIVDALAEIDADVFGLIEIENNADVALKRLTDALNAQLGSEVYKYIATGKIGTDVITTALMYKPATVEPLGAFKLMNGTVSPAWDDSLHRPGLTQTFGSVETGEKFTVVVNHLKSKGSACPTGNDPQQGNCNGPRAAAAAALATWLATDPTGQGTVGRELIIGDLNSYDKEDPITALTTAGYTDLLLKYQGEDAYTYVFDGQLGYLDHGLAGPGLLADITGAAPWNVNSDEPDILDYNTNFKSAAQVEQWFAPDAYRSSDHDPVIVGIDLDTTPPTLEVSADPAKLWPPNNKARTVTITVDAADDSGEVSVELIETTATGNKKAAIEQVTDTSFRVIAAQGSVYTFTYEATDAVGNATTATATVKVER